MVPSVVPNQPGSPYEDLLSLSMSNYQITRELMAECLELAKRGKGELTKAYPYHMLKDLPEKDQRSMRLAAANPDLGAESDRSMLETQKEITDKATSTFLFYIDYGIAAGLIVPGQALERKIERSESERKKAIDELNEIRGELEQVSTQLVSVRALYEDCQRRLHIHPADDRLGSRSGN
jgi:hypothetical protein